MLLKKKQKNYNRPSSRAKEAWKALPYLITLSFKSEKNNILEQIFTISRQVNVKLNEMMTHVQH